MIAIVTHAAFKDISVERCVWQLDCGSLMLLLAMQLFPAMTSQSIRAHQNFVSTPQVWFLTRILYRLQMSPKTFGLARAEAVSRLG